MRFTEFKFGIQTHNDDLSLKSYNVTTLSVIFTSLRVFAQFLQNN
jgi:hypothetical protein